MSISPINSSQAAATAKAVSGAGTASDGDSKAVEAAESSTTKLAEKLNGGFAPKSAQPVSPTSPTSATNPVSATTATSKDGINKIV
jgi:hypothetical protein